MPLDDEKAEKKTKAGYAGNLRRDCRPSAEAAHDLMRWILTDGRIEAIGEDPARDPSNPERFINGLCQRIVASGVRLTRVVIYAETLHPQTRGFCWRWRHEGCIAEEVKIAQARELTQAFLHSPIRRTIEQGMTLRQRLDAAPSACPLLEELQGDGCRAYLAMALNCINRRYPIVVWGTDRIDGFSDSEIALLEEIRPALSAVIQVLAVLRTALGLFSIYLDDDVGRRVIDGQVLRGHTDSVNAVIMAADLRGFTSLSNRLPAEQVIGILNDFFETVVSSVTTHGGNVLKFIGDGALAIFGANAAPDQAAARAALSATRKILEEMAGYKFEGGLRVGIGLHVGAVMYGNVGSADRLDFTVIGPAVNRAFRLEALTKQLGCPALTSRAFADASGESLVSLGLLTIRGLDEPEEVFGLPEHH